MPEIVELRTVIHLDTPLGKAEAHFMYGGGLDGTEWGCFQLDTGEFWWWPNRLIRVDPSLTNYRPGNSHIHLTPRMKAKLAPHVRRAMETRETGYDTQDVSIEPQCRAPRDKDSLSYRQPDVRPAEGKRLPTDQQRRRSGV